MKIVGIQRNVKFDIDGRTYNGLSIYALEERNNVEGFATVKEFINDTKPCYNVASTLKVGDEIKPSYNRWGKIEDIIVCKQ